MSGSRIILALDVPNLSCAEDLARSVSGEVGVLKVGLELFMSAGRAAVELGKSTGHDIFLDLKLHDIPETVERAVRQAADMGVRFVTVHAQQRETLERVARLTQGTETTALVVTVLTSMSDEDMRWMGLPSRAGDQAEYLAERAYQCGIRGFVCSPSEVGSLSRRLPNSVFVVPGIRPSGSPSSDQKRVGTPAQAVRDGATYLVVGRPIRDAFDRRAAARQIAAEIASVQ